jgi:membrane protein implicated in regulation of membrane protease activity
MEHWTTTFSTLDRIFLLAGIVGTIVVLYRMVALFFGGDLEGEAFEDAQSDGHGGTGEGLHFLSVHGLSSFLMMFGLVGLALSRQSQAGMGLSILGGILAGLASVWVIARLFHLTHGLQSSGTLQPQAAAGCVGTVYLTIPAGGTGRVNVRIGQRTREMDAIHPDGAELPTGTPVWVVRVERSLAIVQPLSATEPPCLTK